MVMRAAVDRASTRSIPFSVSMPATDSGMMRRDDLHSCILLRHGRGANTSRARPSDSASRSRRLSRHTSRSSTKLCPPCSNRRCPRHRAPRSSCATSPPGRRRSASTSLPCRDSNCCRVERSRHDSAEVSRPRRPGRCRAGSRWSYRDVLGEKTAGAPARRSARPTRRDPRRWRAARSRRRQSGV